mmetsp:Transcript_47848/g.113927  ORF Transcript_47848/g.113927 Transcript_47848/m.113927 type:complete len:262 (+) Transcript_47848:60-845(+)
MASIGMMDAAFFVGKNELLTWLNDILQLNYTKVEQCANGAAYCQIVDAIYPGDVNMKKVIFDAKLEHDFIKNYKVLQAAFDKKQIAKHIEVNKLVKAKPLDNLEFLQWIKRYFDLHFGGQEYNAVQRRGGVTAMLKENTSGNKPTPSSATTVVKTGAQRVAGRPVSAAATKRVAEADDKVAMALKEELTSLKLTVAELEKERDFYFGKLRDVEITCQTNESTEVTKLVDDIQKILYSTAEDVVLEPAAMVTPTPTPEAVVA